MIQVARFWKLRWSRRALSAIPCGLSVGLIAFVLTTPASHADPGGSSARIDQQARIRVASQSVTVHYTMMMNRAAAYLEVLAMDKNGDGEISPAEQKAYFENVSRQIAAGLELSLNGCELSLQQIGEMQLSMPFTKQVQFQARQPHDWQTARFDFHNDNYLAARGNISISVESADPIQVTVHSVADDAVEPTLWAPTLTHQRDAVICCRNVAATGTDEKLSVDGNRQSDEASPGVHFSSGWIDSGRTTLVAWWITIAAAALAFAGLFWVSHRRQCARGSLVAVALIVLAVCPRGLDLAWKLSSPPDRILSDDEAATILSILHKNMYDALGASTEDELYDTLASSLEGRLLHETYLEMHRLTLARDMPSRFQVHRIKPLKSDVLHEAAEIKDEFRVRHRWRAYGIISHSGHRHARVNEYEATFSLSKKQNGWRICDASVHDYHRTDTGLVRAAFLR